MGYRNEALHYGSQPFKVRGATGRESFPRGQGSPGHPPLDSAASAVVYYGALVGAKNHVDS